MKERVAKEHGGRRQILEENGAEVWKTRRTGKGKHKLHL